MKRRLLNLLTALSLLLCVAVSGLWVWSYGWSVDWVLASPRRTNFISLRTGGAIIESWFSNRRLREGWEWRQYGPNRGGTPLIARPTTPMNRLGFFYGRRSGTGYVGQGVAFPYWCPLLAFATAPAIRLQRRMARRSRRRSQLCPTCGYDLRATPGRCPECGTEAPTLRLGSAAEGPSEPPKG